MPDGVLAQLHRSPPAPWLEVPTDKADEALMQGSSVWRGSNSSIDLGYGRFIKANVGFDNAPSRRRSLPRIVMRGTVSTAWCP
jgi:hypothetical protein